MNTTLAPEYDTAVAVSGYVTYQTTFFQPLTTIFTPPTQCYTLVTGALYYSFEVFGSPTTTSRLDITPCLPTEASATVLSSIGRSPGTTLVLGPFTCPYGWSLVSSRTESTTRTASTCCPSGYNYRPTASTGLSGHLQCTSVVPAGVPYQALVYGSFVPTSAKNAVTFTATALSGYNIERRFAPATSTSGSGGYPSGPGATGSKVGLGVGITLGVVLLAALVAWLSLSSHKKQRPYAEAMQQVDAWPQDPGPLQHEICASGMLRPVELHGGVGRTEPAASRRTTQLDSAPQPPAELQHSNNMYELPSPTLAR